MLSLVEVRSIRLPTGSAVRGADLSADGDVLYWTDSSVIVVASDSASGSIHLCRGQLFRPVGAAFAGPDSRVEIVDAGYRSVYRATREGSCTRQLLPLYAKDIADAVHDDAGWLLLLSAKERKAEVARFRYGADPVRLFEFAQDSATPTDLASSYFGLSNGFARLVNVLAVHVDSSGHVRNRPVGIVRAPGRSAAR